MFIKTLYGEVVENAWNGVDTIFEEVESIEIARQKLAKIISLEHDFSGEWLASDVEKAASQAKAIQKDEGSIRIRSVKADESETYSVYEYSIVSEKS